LRTIEKEVILNPSEYHGERLGELSEGDSITGECSEDLHENFSYYILAETNMTVYENSGEIKNSIKSKRNVDKIKIECKIKIKDTYFLLFVHQATVNARNIRFRVEVERKK
jgi:hypothetical protein